MLNGIDLISAERLRQQDSKLEGGEGYDINHDRGHTEDLARAAATYAMPPSHRIQGPHSILRAPESWPWDQDHWKPDTTGTRQGRIRELQKAGALIAAAIDAELDAIARGGQ